MPGNVALGAIAAALLIVAGVPARSGVRQRERQARRRMAAEADAAVLAAVRAALELLHEIVLSVLGVLCAQPRASTVDEASLLAMLRASQRRQHLDDDGSLVRRSSSASRGDARGEVPTAAGASRVARRQRIVAAEAHIAPLRARLSKRSATRRPEVAGLVALASFTRAMSARCSRLRRQLWWASSTRR